MARTWLKLRSMAFYKLAFPILLQLFVAWFVVAGKFIIGQLFWDTFCAANKIIKGDFVLFLALHFKDDE